METENHTFYIYTCTGIINGTGYIMTTHNDEILDLKQTQIIYNNDYKLKKLEQRIKQLESE